MIKSIEVINLSKNYSHKINEINCDCINISSGQIHIGKSNILDFFEIRKKYFKVVKKIFVDSYLKKFLEIKKKIPYFFEIETFNLRNDKNKYTFYYSLSKEYFLSFNFFKIFSTSLKSFSSKSSGRISFVFLIV